MSAGALLDSSVLVALLAKEPGWTALADRVDQVERRFTSAVAVLETVMVLASLMRVEPHLAGRIVNEFLTTHDVRLMTIDAAVGSRAIQAFEAFGKGRHPARLNLGDCLSYACAKEAGLTLLYKGGDFARTDLA